MYPQVRAGIFYRQSFKHALQHALAQFIGLSAWAHQPVDQQQSEAVHERPKDQDGRGDLSLVSRCFRNGRPRAPCSNRIREKFLRLLSRGDFDGRAAIVRSGEVAAEHQSVEGRILDAMTHVIARDSE